MKKSLVVVGTAAVAVVIVLLGSPYWFGIKTEATFHERVSALTAKSGLGLASERFDRGWLSSSAETVLRVPGIPIEVAAQHTIYHGPVRLDHWLEGRISLEPMQAQIETRGTLNVLTQGSPTSLPFTVNTTITFNGEGYARLESPAQRRAKDDGVDWLGLTGDIHFDTAMQHIRAEMQAPRFAYGAVEIADLKVSTDVREGIAGHYLGKARLEIGSASIGPLMQAKKLGVTTETAAQGGNLAVMISYDILDVRTPTSQFGPGKLAIAVRKLDAVTLARFQQEMGVLQRSDRPQEQIGLMRLGKLMQLVGELAKNVPELEITELQLRMGNEEITGKAKLVLDGSKADLAQNPLLILTAVAGDAEVLLPPAMLKPLLLPLLLADLENYRQRGLLNAQAMTPEQTSAILDQALPLYLSRHDFTRRLVHESGRYRLTASLRRGQVLVNGEPFSMPGASVLPQLP